MMNGSTDFVTAPDSQWLPLLEYAVKTGISVSTLRRHIKSGKIPHRTDDGRYYLRLDTRADSSVQSAVINELRAELQRAHEEIAELKTLIAFYEDPPHGKPSGEISN